MQQLFLLIEAAAENQAQIPLDYSLVTVEMHGLPTPHNKSADTLMHAIQCHNNMRGPGEYPAD